MKIIQWLWSLIMSLFNKKQEKEQEANTKFIQNAIGENITQIGVQNNYKN